MLLNVIPPLQIEVHNVNRVAVKIIWCMIPSQQWNRTDYSDQGPFSHHHFDHGNYAGNQQYCKQGENNAKGNYSLLFG